MDQQSENVNEAPSRVPIEIPPILTAKPSIVAISQDSSTPRWKKRLLFIAFALVLIGAVGWATSPRPKLLRPADEVLKRIDHSVHSVAQEVDRAINEDIQSNGLSKADKAGWLTIARRLSLALVGNGLSLEEIRVLEQIPESDRVEWWTEYLLEDRRSSDYLAERWTRATVGTNQGPFLLFRRRKYVDWFADQIQANKPYDVIVRNLIESQGSWIDNPQTNFLTATMDESDNKRPDAVRLAGRTSRAFLAQRIDCLQCHHDYLGKVNFTDNLDAMPNDANHSEEELKELKGMRSGEQSNFHELAAFFSGSRLENPFVGLKDQAPDYRIKYLHDDEETSVTPKVPYREDLLPEQGDTRHRLAIWVTHPENKAFARATVNRMWAILFGKPWVEPIDSIPLAGPFPAGMEILSDDFIKNGYDLRRMIRTIVATEAFQRDSRIEADDTDTQITAEEMQEKHWAIFPLTQLRPEQVAASIHQSARIKTLDESSSIITQLEFFGGVNDFIKAYGDRGDDEFNQQSVTIPQRLLVMNGSYVSERVEHNPIANTATRIAMLTSAKDDKTAVTTAYLATLNRIPTGRELNAFCDRLRDTKGFARSQAMSSIFWTLINSTEFQWNH